MGEDPTLAPGDDEDLCYLAGDWRIFQKQRGHRWSLDDLVTAAVAAEHIEALGASHLLDLGCGLGSVMMLLAWRFPRASVIGVEAQPDRAAMARRSLRFNGAEQRCQVIDGDLRDFVGPSVDFISGTPPYFPRGTGTESDQAHARPCRFELRGGVEVYLEAAARLLGPQGRVVLCSAMLEVDRVERAATEAGLHLLEHVEIIPRVGKGALIAVDAFSRHPGPLVERTLTVRDEHLQWTPAFQAVRTQFGMPSTR